MEATEQLKAEHEGIMLMLGVLGKVCDKLESGERIGAGKHEEFHRLLESLEKEYLG